MEYWILENGEIRMELEPLAGSKPVSQSELLRAYFDGSNQLLTAIDETEEICSGNVKILH